MKIYYSKEYSSMANPTPGQTYRQEILSAKEKAKDLGGIIGVMAPGSPPRYHYHNTRESIIIAISGEAIEVCEGKEFPFKAGDVIFVPAKEKHMTLNRSKQDFRYLEFFTHPPAGSDFVEVKE